MPGRRTESPTRTEIRRSRKAELQEWCEQFDLDASGTVAELRARLLEHLESLEQQALKEEVEEAEAEEEGEIVEEVYEVKQKPALEPAKVELLSLRLQILKRRPTFRRQEWFRYRKLGDGWRRPRGHHSKLRRRFKYRGASPSVGYRGPREARGMHPSGFWEVLVHRPMDLEGMDPKTQAARIAHSVGTRKRIAIQERADELEIRILNRVVE